MCKMIEDMRNASYQEGEMKRAIESAKRMLANGKLTAEEIAECIGLSLDKVLSLRQ